LTGCGAAGRAADSQRRIARLCSPKRRGLRGETMSGARPEGLHDRYCANRNVATAAIFVAGCAWTLVGFWMAWVRPHTHTTDYGAPSLFFQACVIFGVGFGFTIFKCLRERVVITLWLLTPARAVLFAAVPRLANWSSFAYRLDLATSIIALVVSISMLTSAIQGRNRPSVSSC
jgi:hypothetical protein